jgi:hypothetical protein
VRAITLILARSIPKVARDYSNSARDFRDVFHCISLWNISFRINEAGEDKRISGMFRLIVLKEDGFMQMEKNGRCLIKRKSGVAGEVE